MRYGHRKGRVHWLDNSGCSNRVSSYPTLARHPYFVDFFFLVPTLEEIMNSKLYHIDEVIENVFITTDDEYYQATGNIWSPVYHNMYGLCYTLDIRKANQFKKSKHSTSLSFQFKAHCGFDSYEECPYWAYNGECENNPGFMLSNCKFSCNDCEGKLNQ